MKYVQNQLEWIASAGGPLVVVERALTCNWGGSFDLIGAESKSDSQYRTDYDRACAVEGHIGVIDVGPGKGLVLGDEPLQTSWVPLPNKQGGVFIRWEWAKDEAAIIRALNALPEEIWNDTGLRFPINEGIALLFDSTLPGTRVDESLSIDVAKGLYAIETARYQSVEEVSMILHRMELISTTIDAIERS